jgi:hypothetical protein
MNGVINDIEYSFRFFAAPRLCVRACMGEFVTPDEVR